MSRWTRVCATVELLPGEYRCVHAGGTPIAVFNIDGTFYALEDVCTHDGSELTGGVIEGHQIECPRHGARFDITTGAVLCAPAYEPVAKFPVKIEDGIVYTRDDRDD
ncbi:MAG: non-heme iron oxygenase ferredoxin subunit [Rhodanobacter sp.]|jgi:3-phenylpropionate/trans-cinnamate dioxygenase ferredoxin subunit|nr:non-heme iron oxygenase ferredoxin subunit [Rhodanobacter sp.]